MKMLKSALAMVALLLSMAAFALDLDAAKTRVWSVSRRMVTWAL